MNGRLFQPGDAESLGRAMAELCADPKQRYRMGLNGFQTAQIRLNWQEVGRKLASVLAQTIADHPKHDAPNP